MAQNLCRHFGTFYFRHADFYFTVIINQQYIVEFHLCTFFCRQTVNIHFTVFFYFKLLSSNLYNSVHLIFLFNVNTTG